MDVYTNLTKSRIIERVMGDHRETTSLYLFANDMVVSDTHKYVTAQTNHYDEKHHPFRRYNVKLRSE